MYQGFSIINIEPSYAEQNIMVTTSFDIDPDSVNDSTVQLFSKVDGVNMNIDIKVHKKTITISPKSEIVPNTEYILRVFKIKNVLGDEVRAGIRRKITFKSEVKDIPCILTPSEHEEVHDLKVKLLIYNEDGTEKAINDETFFIQIAKDVAFIDVIMETSTNKKETNLKDLVMGQYYLRARVEKNIDGNKESGAWSKTVTFISLKQNIDEPCQPPEIDEPEYIEYVSVINIPANGETPETILIEFSGDIDPDSIEDIIVIRRDI